MKFAEFFAGVGLVREGLESTGWKCVWANDISSDKMHTYVKNYGEEHFHLEDIWKVAAEPEKVIPSDIFLYTASFPCTDLSVAGARAGLAGSESGTLNAVLEILRKKKLANDLPKMVMLENVSGFLTSHNGKDVLETVNILSDLGYFIDIIELDAVLFTPQSRPRVFLIAVEKSIASHFMNIKNTLNPLDTWWKKFDEQPILRSKKLKKIIISNEDLNWGLFDIPLPQPRNQKLDDIIEIDIPVESPLWWSSERKEHLFSQMSQSHKLKLNEMVENEGYSYGTVFRRMRSGKSMAELRTDGVAGCLRTPRGGSSKQILICAGYGSWRVRLLTPREYARLQGVRDDFILPSNMNKGYFAMGDAVCVPAIEYLSKHALSPVYHAFNNE
ncbi:DNA (cytosine-5-)-methyltransferase [Tatumella punctata]|uniref:DNA (cytosine-5-)-methyltransferase n=1 Tax=Tatumella punctata TaxID=399969 RepID=A0ABW1VLR0_9GAMM